MSRKGNVVERHEARTLVDLFFESGAGDSHSAELDIRRTE